MFCLWELHSCTYGINGAWPWRWTDTKVAPQSDFLFNFLTISLKVFALKLVGHTFWCEVDFWHLNAHENGFFFQTIKVWIFKILWTLAYNSHVSQWAFVWGENLSLDSCSCLERGIQVPDPSNSLQFSPRFLALI